MRLTGLLIALVLAILSIAFTVDEQKFSFAAKPQYIPATLQARAFDAAGNVGYSQEVHVRVKIPQ